MDINKIYRILKKQFNNYPAPVVDLIEAQIKDPFKIIVTTMLSVRTKDQTTSEVANRLFETVNKPEDLNKYTLAELEELIYPVGFFRNKARYLKEFPKVLKVKFNNDVPRWKFEISKYLRAL